VSVADRDQRASSSDALGAPLEAFDRAGHWRWETRSGSDHFLFVGKATHGSERELLAELAQAGIAIATARQIHSRRVLDAAPGDSGEGDALVTTRPGLALRVVTADCVPVLLSSPTAIAAVHAGWRGLRAGVLDAAVRRMGADGAQRAIIGPAIGACCYEVGFDVASEVAARVGSTSVIVPQGDRERPHLDLALAARLALRDAGVGEIVTVDACTRCDPTRLWSYRREGRAAGRNLALIWRDV
jgi:YfiH family protein